MGIEQVNTHNGDQKYRQDELMFLGRHSVSICSGLKNHRHDASWSWKLRNQVLIMILIHLVKVLWLGHGQDP
jgi:hypothetical protein